MAGGPVSFPGTNFGSIPDNNPSGRAVTFVASGLSEPVAAVTVSMDLTHTFVGDLTAVLTSPAGVARMVVFGRTGTSLLTSFGDSTNLGGQYLFSDAAPGNLWTEAAAIGTNEILPSGAYFASSSGAPARSNAGGCRTSLDGVFGGLSAGQANGTWTLTLVDGAGGDLGSIDAATLSIEGGGVDIFGDGFESVPRSGSPVPQGAPGLGDCINKVQADFTGDGLSDYALARDVAGSIHWSIRENLPGGTAAAVPVEFDLGVAATDFLDTIDFDGDRIADAVVWTPGSPGTFQIRRSSRSTDAVVSIPFGQNGDDVLNSGDFDGDGRDDLAVFRAPPIGSPGPIQMLVRASSTGLVQTVPLGTGEQFAQFVSGGFDFNGDSLADIAVQRTDPGVAGGGFFTIHDGRTAAELGSFAFGRNTDIIMPGNYTGTPWYDVTVSRSETLMGVPGRSYYSRDSATGTEDPVVRFGIAGDVRVGGDYDGDGLSDYGIWRPSATPGMSQFQIRSSRNTATIFTVMDGQSGDFAVGSSKVK